MEVSFTETVRENSANVIAFATDLFKVMALADTPVGKRIDVKYDKYEASGLKKMAKAKGLRIARNTSREEMISLLREADAEAVETELQQKIQTAEV